MKPTQDRLAPHWRWQCWGVCSPSSNRAAVRPLRRITREDSVGWHGTPPGEVEADWIKIKTCSLENGVEVTGFGNTLWTWVVKLCGVWRTGGQSRKGDRKGSRQVTRMPLKSRAFQVSSVPIKLDLKGICSRTHWGSTFVLCFKGCICCWLNGNQWTPGFELCSFNTLQCAFPLSPGISWWIRQNSPCSPETEKTTLIVYPEGRPGVCVAWDGADKVKTVSLL